MRRITLSLVALALLAATAPAGAANREHDQILADIRMLQEQNQRLQLALVTLAEALKTVSAKIDESNAATRKGFADQKLFTDGVGGDLRVLREKLDETNVRLTSLSQDVDGLREIIPQAGSAAAAPLAPVDPERAADARAPRRRLPARPCRRRCRPCRQARERRPSACTTPPMPTTPPGSGRWRCRDSRRT